MKKTIAAILILVSMNVYAQNLDTVLVRSFTLQGQDWAWIAGGLNNQIDSATARHYRRIRTKIRAANPQSWTQNIAVDSIPGYIVLDWYRAVKTANAGEIAQRYTAITNAISAQQNLAYWIGATDATLQNDYLTRRQRGKTILMDE
jgi:hypothetical protein